MTYNTNIYICIYVYIYIHIFINISFSWRYRYIYIVIVVRLYFIEVYEVRSMRKTFERTAMVGPIFGKQRNVGAGRGRPCLKRGDKIADHMLDPPHR